MPDAPDLPAASENTFTLPRAVPAYRRPVISGHGFSAYIALQHPAQWKAHRHRQHLQVGIVGNGAKGEGRWRGPNGRLVVQKFDGPCLWMVPVGMLHSACTDVEVPMAVFYAEEDWVTKVSTERLVSCSLEPLAEYTQADPVIEALSSTFTRYCYQEKLPSDRQILDAGATLMRHILAAHLAPREQALAAARGLSPSVLDWVKSHIAGHIAGGASFETMARHAGMTPDYFSRMFRMSTGRTLEVFQNECRVRKGKALLASGEFTSIADVAKVVGCWDHSHLNKVFQSAHELPPSVFFRRKEVR